MDKISCAFCCGINACVYGEFLVCNSCGLPAFPVGEQCGVDLLLILDAHCAACPIMYDFYISFCVKKKLLQQKEHPSDAYTLSGVSHGLCLSMPGIRIVVALAVLPLFI
jgi:hypothetical protein